MINWCCPVKVFTPFISGFILMAAYAKIKKGGMPN